jgi:hypothetical protein
MTRTQATFGALILGQAAHSIEEYAGRLWESFPPAAYLTGLLATDRRIGFLIINIGLILFGVWCFLVPVRRNWKSATGFMWFWIIIETINGVGHPAWSLAQQGYTPGALTAPVLLGLAVYLAFLLRQAASRPKVSDT